MIRDAIKCIFDWGDAQSEIKTKEINGIIYSKDSVREVKPNILYADPITVTTLDSLVDYIKGMNDEFQEISNLMIHVENEKLVHLIGCLDRDRRREKLIDVVPSLPHISFNEYLPQDEFIIMLQSCFEQSDDQKLLLQVAGTIESKTVKTYFDDGLAQSAVVNTGIASKEEIVVPDKVTLRPFRTFQEVAQPSEQFVFRMREDSSGRPSFMLKEADGGAWKLVSINCIQEYIRQAIDNCDADIKDKIHVI